MSSKSSEKDINELVDTLEKYNAAYRAGTPVVSDNEYDKLVQKLRGLDAENPYLQRVEPEPEDFFSGELIEHESPMLSTDKAYTKEDLAAFFRRVEACATDLGMDKDTITYSANAKLDGLSGRLYMRKDRRILSTRGTGLRGNDISCAWDRGLVAIMGDDHSEDYVDGEIVIEEKFFQESIAPLGFKYARNFMVGFVRADTVKDHHHIAGASGKARFVAYDQLPAVSGSADFFLNNIADINEQIRKNCEYKTDGIVLSVDNMKIRSAIGSTHNYHRWQIAFKTQEDGVETRVTDVLWQTGRTGRVTPVVITEPVEFPGATVRRVTAHTARMIANKGIGRGALILLVRSGDVIPKILDVVERVDVSLPEVCPSCGHKLETDGEYLICPSLQCTAQAECRITHFFGTLENADGFGPKSVEKIVGAGVTSIADIMRLTDSDFVAMGFGTGQAENLCSEISRCVTTPVEDWRFLAAFGIRHLGRGDSRNLLDAIGSIDALKGIRWDTIAGVSGFAEKTAKSIAADLERMWDEISCVREFGFNLVEKDRGVVKMQSVKPLTGMSLVFTGTFSLPRVNMENSAQSYGAQVQQGVNKKTTAVVVGANPGAGKTKKAEELGTPTWTEAYYYDMINPVTCQVGEVGS